MGAGSLAALVGSGSGHLQGSVQVTCRDLQDCQAREVRKCPNTAMTSDKVGNGQPMKSITAPMLVAWLLHVPVKQANREGRVYSQGKRPDAAQYFTQWRGSAGDDAREMSGQAPFLAAFYSVLELSPVAAFTCRRLKLSPSAPAPLSHDIGIGGGREGCGARHGSGA